MQYYVVVCQNFLISSGKAQITEVPVVLYKLLFEDIKSMNVVWTSCGMFITSFNG